MSEINLPGLSEIIEEARFIMNYRGIMRLIDTTGKCIASNRYWGKDQRQRIMDIWADKYPDYKKYSLIIRPAIDHKTAIELLRQYPQLKYNGTH